MVPKKLNDLIFRMAGHRSEQTRAGLQVGMQDQKEQNPVYSHSNCTQPAEL